MEFEQIIKRLEWLDQEHRKDKKAISALQEQIASLEVSLNGVSKQIRSLGRQTTEAATSSKRLAQFDAFLAEQRTEMSQALDALEKRNQRREREMLKRHQAELEAIHQTVAGLRSGSDPEIRKRFKERADETQRLETNLNDLRKRVEDVLHAGQEVVRGQQAADEVRKQDLKRMADIQGELTSLRKRSDENRDRNILHSDSVRNIENRLTELFTTEANRNQAQAAFLEGQSRAQLERDKAWKEWRDRYETILKEAGSLESQMNAIDETMRAAKRAQETYQELNTKLERRVSEVTELQRLGEDRLRQEWTAFKAEDQKRWTGHTLSSEESLRDLRKDQQKMEARLSGMDDLTQLMQDQMHQTTDTTEQQLKELMNIVHEWMTSYERIMGHNKKPAKKSGA